MIQLLSDIPTYDLVWLPWFLYGSQSEMLKNSWRLPTKSTRNFQSEVFWNWNCWCKIGRLIISTILFPFCTLLASALFVSVSFFNFFWNSKCAETSFGFLLVKKQRNSVPWRKIDTYLAFSRFLVHNGKWLRATFSKNVEKKFLQIVPYGLWSCVLEV